MISALALMTASVPANPAARKPNVIIIYTDDQGSVDAGCYGSDIQTPNIDRLADQGVRFTRMYAPAPVCSPSRAGLLTGRYPLRAGMQSNVGPGSEGMPGSQVTIAETFKAAGYATAHIGKWHLGWHDTSDPLGQGFDHSFGHMGGCIDNYSHFFYWNGPNRHDLVRNRKEVFMDGQHFGDLMVYEAAGFIAEHREEPFFMYYAINAPHYPYQGSTKWLDEYADTEYPRNLYSAFTSFTDEKIGELIEELELQEIRDDTIIIYQSDHGHSVEVRAHSGGGDNGPYRGHKFTLFEGGIRVPSVISWPGHIPEGEVRNQTVHGSDWLPTVAKLADIPLIQKDIDGQDISDVILKNTKQDTRTLHWQMGMSDKAHWAVMRGPWKLIANSGQPADGPELTAEQKKLFLVNVDENPGEDRSAENPQMKATLLMLHNEWAASLPK